MKIAFLIPFRTDNGHRQTLFDWTLGRINYFFPDAKVYVGESGPGEFNRSAAINDAFSQTKDEDVVIINDADTVWNSTLVYSGINSLVHDGRFVLPYKTYCIMDQPSSFKLLSLPYFSTINKSEYDYDIIVEANSGVYHAPPVSGVIMMRTDDYLRVGGFDESFIGWGEEDVAFVIKASGYIGRPVRVAETVYHIWHPRGLDYGQPHYKENRRILRKNYL